MGAGKPKSKLTKTAAKALEDQMAKKKMSMKFFEKSSFDKDTKKAPEGSKADMARDKKQLAAVNRKK